MPRSFRVSRWIKQFAGDCRGSIAITSSVFFAVAITASALTVDLGSLYLERRQAQGTADLAALAAAADLDHASAAATATLNANGISNTTSMVVETGRYEDNASLAVGDRFKPGVLPLNAARVRFAKPGRTYFAKAFNGTCCSISVTAIGTAQQLATFSIGSRLASVREGVVNGLLGGLLGGNLTLSAMDYNALVAANVELLDFSNALATRLSLTGVTYDQLTDASANVGDIINALITVSDHNGTTTASSALRLLLAQSTASVKTVSLSSLLDFGKLGDKLVGSAVPGKFSVMDFISGSATLANGNTMVSVDLGASIPGLLSTKLDVAIGEPPQTAPWAAVGEKEATVRTAQTRARITVEVAGTGLLSITRLKVPIYVDLAYAQGRLSKIACASDGTGAVTVGVKPGVAAAAIGEVSNAQMTDFHAGATINKATIVQVTLNLLLLHVDVKVLGKAYVEAGSVNETSLTFSQSDITNGTIKRASSNALTESMLSTLLGQLVLEATVAPLAITTPSAINTLVASILSTAVTPVDAVVYNLLNTLGVHAGEADVRVHGVQCKGAVLAG